MMSWDAARALQEPRPQRTKVGLIWKIPRSILQHVTPPLSRIMFILFLCPKCSSDPQPTKSYIISLPGPFQPNSSHSLCSIYTIFQVALWTCLARPVDVPLNGTFLYHFLHSSLCLGLFSKVTSSEQTFPPPYGEIRQHSDNSQVFYFALTFKRSCVMHLLVQLLISAPPPSPECKL